MDEAMATYFKSMTDGGSKWAADYTMGQRKAYWAWRNSFGHGPELVSSEFECDDLPYDEEMQDFIQTLREAGVKTLAVTDGTSGLMCGIHILADLGCTMEGLCKVTRTDICFGEVETKEVQGIRFRLN